MGSLLCGKAPPPDSPTLCRFQGRACLFALREALSSGPQYRGCEMVCPKPMGGNCPHRHGLSRASATKRWRGQRSSLPARHCRLCRAGPPGLSPWPCARVSGPACGSWPERRNRLFPDFFDIAHGQKVQFFQSKSMRIGLLLVVHLDKSRCICKIGFSRIKEFPMQRRSMFPNDSRRCRDWRFRCRRLYVFSGILKDQQSRLRLRPVVFRQRQYSRCAWRILPEYAPWLWGYTQKQCPQCHLQTAISKSTSRFARSMCHSRMSVEGKGLLKWKSGPRMLLLPVSGQGQYPHGAIADAA